MLARGNGEATGPNEWRGRKRKGRMRRATIPWMERRGRSRERSERFLPLGVRSEPTSVTEKRTEKEKTAPKALLYLSYNYHNRAPHRTPPLPTNPAHAPRVLFRPQPQIGNSRIHFPFVAHSLASSLAHSLVRSFVHSPRSKLFAVGRRPSSQSEGC